MGKHVFKITGFFSDGGVLTSVFHLVEPRQNIALINVERFFLVSAHQIQVKLRYSYTGQLAQPLLMSFRRTHHAETVDHFIRDEIRIFALHHTVMKVVVTAPVLDV